MMRIAVLTATRAEYGLLSPIVKRMLSDAAFEVRVLVTGAHLSCDFGNTYQEIEADGIPIATKIPILESGNGAENISRIMGNALIRFAEYFSKDAPDALMVLGDRYETLAVCCAAMNAQIPILHLHGGETTQGAIDEAIRHSITKMSYLHFTSTDEYRKRVIQLGENPNHVFSVGAVGVENVQNMPLLEKGELAKSIGISLERPYILGTYHPVTLEGESIEKQIDDFLSAIDELPQYTYIITKANADAGGMQINERLEAFAKEHSNVYVVASLGVVRYLSAVKYSEMVIGNSSSGIIEVPSFHVPTVNIGDRQKGRTSADSVIHCNSDKESIVEAMALAQSEDFKVLCNNTTNPYEKKDAVERIVSIIKQEMVDKKIDLKKEFFDIPFEEA